MLYEVSLKRVEVNEVGLPKEVKEQYLINDDLFASVEQKAMAMYNNDCDVFAIKRSKAQEVIDRRENDEQSIYDAVIVRSDMDDNGVIKNTKYQVYFHAESLKEATDKILNYTKQSLLDEEVKQVKKTKFIDLI